MEKNKENVRKLEMKNAVKNAGVCLKKNKIRTRYPVI